MSKFEALLENTLVRYQRSQFITGDLIQFKKNWQKNTWVQANQDYAQKIRNFIESGDNLRVSAVKASPSSVHGSFGSYENEQANLIDITQEYAPGLYRDFMTVPSNIIEVIDTNNNLAPIPASKKRKDNTTLKPQDVKIGKATDKYGPEKETGLGESGDRKLNNKNVKLPHGNKWNDKKPGAGNTKGLKKVAESFALKKDDSDLIFEAMYKPTVFDKSQSCPGCGCNPGEGLTEGCTDPNGCGHWRGAGETQPKNDACPSCGSTPGNGITEGCNDMNGCGHWRQVEKELKHVNPAPPAATSFGQNENLGNA